MENNLEAIILNGTSSSGKTTLAKCLQHKISNNTLYFPMDAFWDMVENDRDAHSQNYPNMKKVITETATAFLKYKMLFILDTVCMEEDYKHLQETLKPHNIFYIAVNADLEILEKREIARGDREIGMAKRQKQKIHKNCIYDFAVDTTHKTTEELVDIILEKIKEKYIIN